jgi:hypothetical protein
MMVAERRGGAVTIIAMGCKKAHDTKIAFFGSL